MLITLGCRLIAFDASEKAQAMQAWMNTRASPIGRGRDRLLIIRSSRLGER
jgi:hypothetical protein